MAEKLSPLSILLITGEKSFQEIKDISDKINKEKKLRISTKIKVAPVSVSAFISQKQVRKIITDIKNEQTDFDFDIVLLPGFIQWDTQSISKEFNLKIYKGTRFSGDLHDLLKNIRTVTLSTKKPADHLLQTNITSQIQDYVKSKEYNYQIGEYGDIMENYLTFEKKSGEIVYTGTEFPPLLFAEIVNAPKLSKDDIFTKIKYYIESGADVIDIGSIYGKDNCEFIHDMIPEIKQKYDVLISIDTVDIKEIITGIEAGVDIILSIDGENIDQFIKYCLENNVSKEIGLVLIPLEGPNHSQVEGTEFKIDILIDMAIKLRKNGFENLFYDPIVKTPISPGLMESLYDYMRLLERCNQIRGLKFPLFMGFNNIFELMDADSPGIISLMASIASELDVGGILTTEYSAKTQGAITETRRSIDLVYWAKISKSPPINIGINAFFSKSKTRSTKRTDKPAIIIDLLDKTDKTDKKNEIPQYFKDALEMKKPFVHDKEGFFKIYCNHTDKKIELLYYPSEDYQVKINSPGPILFIGRTAEGIYKEIDKLGIVTESSHAFYIGKELSKAEYALQINSGYQEDTKF